MKKLGNRYFYLILFTVVVLMLNSCAANTVNNNINIISPDGLVETEGAAIEERHRKERDMRKPEGSQTSQMRLTSGNSTPSEAPGILRLPRARLGSFFLFKFILIGV